MTGTTRRNMMTTPSGTPRNEITETPTEVRARLVGQLEIHQAEVEARQAKYDAAREKANKAHQIAGQAYRSLEAEKEQRDKVRQMLIDALPEPDPEPEAIAVAVKR